MRVGKLFKTDLVSIMSLFYETRKKMGGYYGFKEMIKSVKYKKL